MFFCQQLFLSGQVTQLFCPLGLTTAHTLAHLIWPLDLTTWSGHLLPLWIALPWLLAKLTCVQHVLLPVTCFRWAGHPTLLPTWSDHLPTHLPTWPDHLTWPLDLATCCHSACWEGFCLLQNLIYIAIPYSILFIYSKLLTKNLNSCYNCPRFKKEAYSTWRESLKPVT